MTKTILKFLPNNQVFFQFLLSGRKKIWLFVFVMIFAQSSLLSQKSFVKNISLIRLLETLEKNYQVSFSYDVSIVKGKKIQYFEYSNKSLEKDLVALFRDSNLGFDQIDNNVIIKQVSPDFFDKYKKKICGQVIDAKAGLPIGHVAVSVENTRIGKNADSLGYFSIEGPFVEGDFLNVSFIGYEPKKLKLSFFLNQPCKTIFLQRKNIKLAEVIVREDYNQMAGIKLLEMEPDVVLIRPDKMMGTGGINPKDVFGTLQQIPGVSSSDETATTLNVRGGASSQNLVMYENITLYHYGHLFGKISSFNEAAVDNVRFNKGSFSSENGGRVSSVINIQGKREIPDAINLKAKLGLLSFGVSGEIPFAQKKATLMVAFRKSIFENSILNNILSDQIFQGTRVEKNQNTADLDSLHQILLTPPQNSFYDFFAKAIWKPTDKDLVDVTGLKMGDKLSYRFSSCQPDECYTEDDSMNISNVGYNASWQHNWQPNFYTAIKYSYSGFDKNYSFFNNVKMDSTRIFKRKENQLNDHSFHLNNQWQKNDIRINFGWQRRKIKAINDNQSLYQMVADTFYDKSIGRTNSLFLDYRHDLSDMFHIFIGNRLSTYDLLDRQLFFEPRFTVTSNPSSFLKIKLSGAVYYQTMNQLLEPEHLLGSDYMWVLAKESKDLNSSLFSLQKSSQFSFGASFRKGSWQASLDLYDKLVDGIPSQVVDFDAVIPQSVGSLHAQGIEIGVQRWGKNTYTIIGYSRGSSTYHFDWSKGDISAPYNQRKQLNLLQGVNYKNFSATINWKLKSGLPYTEFNQILIDTIGPNHFEYQLEYKDYNEGLLPKYSRIDLALQYAHQFKWGKGTINVSALNIAMQKNILKRNYSLSVSEKVQMGLADPTLVIKERKGLPFTPNISVSFEFGVRNASGIPKQGSVE